MLGIVLVIAGLLLWLLGGYLIIGVVLLVIGLVLCFQGPYSYGHYRGRRAPP